MDPVGTAAVRATRSRGGDAVRFLDQMDEGELRGPVDSDVEMELTLCRLHFGDVDVEEADRVILDRLLCRLPSRFRHPAGGRCRAVANSDGGSNGSAAAGSAAARRGNHPMAARYVAGRRRRSPRPQATARWIWPRGLINERAALPPLRDRLRIDPVALGESPPVILTMLYRSKDRLCCRGAP